MTHPKNEKTLVLIKPDGVQRSLIGEIIKRFEQTGLKLVGLKMLIPDRETALKHYNFPNEWFEEKGANIIKIKEKRGESVEKSALEYGKGIQNALLDFITAGPIVAMVWQGNQAAGIIRKIVGSTEPLSSDVGTIRGDYTIDSYAMADLDQSRAVRNLIHASESAEEGERESQIWFSENEILKYNLVQDKILYDVNLDGIKE